MREFEEVKAEVKKLEEKHNKLVNEYTDKFEGAKKREAAALEAAEKAYKNAKAEDYAKAQEEARVNHDVMQMYAAKLEDLKKDPIITQEKFNELRADIAEYLGGIVQEDKDSLRDLVKEMIEIKDNEEKDIDEGNALIEHLQRNLLKDPCGIFASNGVFIPQPNKVKIFDDYSVMSFLRFVTKHPLVEDLIEQPQKPTWVKH